MHERKYAIMNIVDKFYIIFKCERQQFENCSNYGINYMIHNNSLDINKMEEYFVTRHIPFRAEIYPIKNPINYLKSLKAVKYLNHHANKANLFLNDSEIEVLLSSLEQGDNNTCWNFSN